MGDPVTMVTLDPITMVMVTHGDPRPCDHGDLEIWVMEKTRVIDPIIQ